MTLTAENVLRIFLASRFRFHPDPDELPDGIDVVGYNGTVHLHKPRLDDFRADVADMLGQLPHQFQEGWTMLNAVSRDDGSQWGEQPDAFRLAALAMGLGLARWYFEPAVWPQLAGGLPHLILTYEAAEALAELGQ